MDTSNLTIEKDKLNLFNDIFETECRSNYSLVSYIYYNVKYQGIIFDNIKSFEYLDKAFYDDCETVMMIFACQSRKYTDEESCYHLNKCIDTLIVYKVLEII